MTSSDIDFKKIPLLEIARLYLARGSSVIPLTRWPGDIERSKKPNLSAMPAVGSTKTRPDGRVTGTWRPDQHRLPTNDERQVWFGRGKRRNIGVSPGRFPATWSFGLRC